MGLLGRLYLKGSIGYDDGSREIVQLFLLFSLFFSGGLFEGRFT